MITETQCSRVVDWLFSKCESRHTIVNSLATHQCHLESLTCNTSHYRARKKSMVYINMANKLQLKRVSPSKLSDDELLRRLSELVQQSRRVESELVAHIGEVDARRLYAHHACSSMFSYCMEVLHLSESESYARIAAARAARRHPMLLEMLRDSRLHLSGISTLAAHLTESNRDDLLARATHKSKRQIELLMAELAPRPDVPTVVRKLPQRSTTALPISPPQATSDELRPEKVDPMAAAVSQPARVMEPLAPSRFKVQFTASAELCEKLERVRKLTDAADLATVIEQAVTEKLERLEARRFGWTERPRKNLEEENTSPSSRYIPAPVERAVQSRDEGRCTFVDESGQRCTERDRLEFHHQRPFALGGDHSADNIVLMCRTHNGYLAEREYGREKMARYRDGSSCVSEASPLYVTRHSSLFVYLVLVEPTQDTAYLRGKMARPVPGSVGFSRNSDQHRLHVEQLECAVVLLRLP